MPARVLDSGWPRREAVRVRELRDTEGSVRLTIDEHPLLGYRLHAAAYGRYVLSRDGGFVRCAPSRTAAWRWQSFLIGQLLPAAAVLHGLEILHASAVIIAGRAVALTGHSQAGKSSVAINLIRRGIPFLADDVVALEPRGADVLAHPGPALASVRRSEAETIGRQALARLGPTVGRDEHEVRLGVCRSPAPAPLGVLYALDRTGEADELAVEPASDARPLLANPFSSFIRSPERLVRQLDVYALVARTTAVFRVSVPATIDAATVAASVHEHALSSLEGPGR
ncbi:MAG: hypothetical protein M3375_00135 [Actinomycetota bacterium]|nr:hypothetical protein [Actinomycetota bacterium]